MPAGPSPPRAPGIRPRARSGRPPTPTTPRRAARRSDRSARRRIDLAVVVQLDDLGRLEERRGHLGEAHHQHRRDGEVRGDHAVRRSVAERRAERLDIGVVEPGRADHGVHAVHRQPRQRHAGRGGDGEVDDDVAGGIGERSELATDRDGPPSVLAAIRCRRRSGRRPPRARGPDRWPPRGTRPTHPPTCAADADPDRHVSDGSRVRGRPSAAAVAAYTMSITRRTSSCVTASQRAS